MKRFEQVDDEQHWDKLSQWVPFIGLRVILSDSIEVLAG